MAVHLREGVCLGLPVFVPLRKTTLATSPTDHQRRPVGDAKGIQHFRNTPERLTLDLMDRVRAAIQQLGAEARIRAYTSCRDTEQCHRLRRMALDFKRRGVMLRVDDERSYRLLPSQYDARSM